jgi:hypothetical protein
MSGGRCVLGIGASIRKLAEQLTPNDHAHLAQFIPVVRRVSGSCLAQRGILLAQGWRRFAWHESSDSRALFVAQREFMG